MPRGRSAASAHSDGSEMDTDGLAETEMVKLQRQFRIMDGDRQAYSIQSQEHVRRQRQEIEKLQREQGELLSSLRVSENLTQQQQDNEDTQALRALLSQRDEVEEELERERQAQAEMEKEIASVERKLAELRRVAVTATSSQKSQPKQTQKATRTLENKLDRALVRFNEQLTKNSHLREELETLRVERVRFQQLHRRLEKELQDNRKETVDMISLSTAAYDARVEAQSKMTTMKEKAVKDLAQYSAEMKELERLIAHERRLKEFMTTKCSERSGQDEGQEAGRRHALEPREQRRTDSGEESLDTLEEVFQRIQDLTGEQDLDMLVTRFIQVEDRNFALFNYVNEQNNEAEALRDQINQTQSEMEQFQVEGLRQSEENHALLRAIDEQQRATEVEAQEAEEEAKAVSKILDQITTGVNRVFSKMKCDQSVEDALGSSAAIKENNLMKYLGLVEQSTNELLTMQAFLSSRDIDKDYDPKDLARFLLGQNPEVPRPNITIHPTVTGDEYDTEDSHLTDEEERPLSQTELRQRIVKGVLRKEGPARHGGARDSKASRNSAPSSSRKGSEA
ncbi:coiled-coil domain-containing protein 114 [Aplochiton taeniatus]